MPRPTGQPTSAQTTRSVAANPNVWIGGIAVAIGLAVGAHERNWQSSFLAGLAAWPVFAIVYTVPAGIFGWPQVRWIDTMDGVLSLLDLIVTILSSLG